MTRHRPPLLCEVCRRRVADDTVTVDRVVFAVCDRCRPPLRLTPRGELVTQVLAVVAGLALGFAAGDWNVYGVTL